MEISSALSRIRQVVYTWTKFVVNLLVINTFGNSDNVIYLTFDDGPCEKHTESIFNTLKELRVNAGFFFNGAAVVNHKELVEKIHSSGFFVGNHSYYHNKYKWYQWSKDIDSIIKGEKLIESVTNYGCKIYRPPFGSINLITFLYLAMNKYKIVQWSVDSRDFNAIEINEIMENISDVKSGDILLFHCDCSLTAAHIANIIHELTAKGFRFGNVSNMLQCPKYV